MSRAVRGAGLAGHDCSFLGLGSGVGGAGVLLWAEPEAAADELNPLTISHTARTISFTPMGRFKATWSADMEPVTPKRTSMPAAKPNVVPAIPQPDSHLGMSLDR
jgi:hypothetical protein